MQKGCLKHLCEKVYILDDNYLAAFLSQLPVNVALVGLIYDPFRSRAADTALCCRSGVVRRYCPTEARKVPPKVTLSQHNPWGLLLRAFLDSKSSYMKQEQGAN